MTARAGTMLCGGVVIAVCIFVSCYVLLLLSLCPPVCSVHTGAFLFTRLEQSCVVLLFILLQLERVFNKLFKTLSDCDRVSIICNIRQKA